jgi:hypothetical protein
LLGGEVLCHGFHTFSLHTVPGQKLAAAQIFF